MEPTLQPLAPSDYQKARTLVLELQCYLQANERTIPYGPTLIKHAERAYQVLPQNGVRDVADQSIACEHLKDIQRMLSEAQELVPEEPSRLCRQILDLLS